MGILISGIIFLTFGVAYLVFAFLGYGVKIKTYIGNGLPKIKNSHKATKKEKIVLKAVAILLIMLGVLLIAIGS